jgi:CheY-like chemotaxis protein
MSDPFGTPSHQGTEDDKSALLHQLEALTQLERRADCLRDELAALHQLLIHVANQPEPERDWQSLCGSETILVADDQVIVRAITQGILESFGYAAIVGDADLRAWSPGLHVDLVLLDVPVNDERALARVRQICERSVRVMVSTPLPDGPARAELRAAGVRAFISKPFRPFDLGRVVRQVLDPAS